MGGYKKLFDVQINHSYFKEGYCKILSLVPTEETQTFLKNADLLLKPFTGGMSILYNTNFTHALTAFLDDEAAIIFKIKSNDPFFFHYTNYGHKTAHTLYFETEEAATLGKSNNLAKNGIVTQNDEKPVSDKTLMGILNKAENLVPPIGVIKIQLNHVLESKNIESFTSPKAYNIHFQSTQTYWRYNLIKKNDIEYDDLSILDDHNKITFTKKKKVNLPNGQTANQITSTQPILLEEYPSYYFNLFGVKDKHKQLIVKRLALPDVKHIKKEQNKVISDLYVYY